MTKLQPLVQQICPLSGISNVKKIETELSKAPFGGRLSNTV